MIFLLNLVAATFKINLSGLDLQNPDEANLNISAPNLFLDDIKAILKLPDGSVNDFELDKNQCLVSKLNLKPEICSYKSFTVVIDIFGNKKEFEFIITDKDTFNIFYEFPLDKKTFEKFDIVQLRLESLTYNLSKNIIVAEASNKYFKALKEAFFICKLELQNCISAKELVSGKTKTEVLKNILEIELKTYQRASKLISNTKNYEKLASEIIYNNLSGEGDLKMKRYKTEINDLEKDMKNKFKKSLKEKFMLVKLAMTNLD